MKSYLDYHLAAFAKTHDDMIMMTMKMVRIV